MQTQSCQISSQDHEFTIIVHDQCHLVVKRKTKSPHHLTAELREALQLKVVFSLFVIKIATKLIFVFNKIFLIYLPAAQELSWVPDVFSKIQSICSVTLDWTLPLHLMLQETIPIRVERPFSWTASGPPESPLHWYLSKSYAHIMLLQKIQNILLSFALY